MKSDIESLVLIKCEYACWMYINGKRQERASESNFITITYFMKTMFGLASEEIDARGCWRGLPADGYRENDGSDTRPPVDLTEARDWFLDWQIVQTLDDHRSHQKALDASAERLVLLRKERENKKGHKR